MFYILLILVFGLIAALLFLEGARQTRILAAIQLEDIPVATARIGRAYSLQATNELWRSEIEPFREGETLQVFTAAIKAADESPDRVVERVGVAHILRARRLPGFYARYLVSAIPRDAHVHTSAILRVLGHDAKKSWDSILPFLLDIGEKRERASFLYKPASVSQLVMDAKALSRTLRPLDRVVSTQYAVAEEMTVSALVEHVRTRLPLELVEVLYDPPKVGDLPLYVHEEGISYILEQIAENARHHGGAKQARLMAEVISSEGERATNGQALVRIHFIDDGAGFDPDALKFVNSGKQVPRANSAAIAEYGLGIGLLLCAAFAREDGGMLEVVDNKHDGATTNRHRFAPERPGVRVTLSLPVWKDVQ